MSTKEQEGRAAFEAMVDACGKLTPESSYILVLRNRVSEWQKAGAWLPTEQHETVTAILERLDEDGYVSLATDPSVCDPWCRANKPGLPKPADPYGPEITVDTGGRCPVEGLEIILMQSKDGLRWAEYHAGNDALNWTVPRTFRRILADHPGDSYWHGGREVIVCGSSPGLDIHDWIVDVTTPDGRRRACTGGPWLSGANFMRWLKGDA